jgi:hypothetical protein
VLVVRPDGRTEEVVTPEKDEGEISSRIAVTAVLDSAGFASARVDMAMNGSTGDAMRTALEREPMDSTAKAQYLRRVASSVYHESEGDNLTFTDETTPRGSVSDQLHGEQRTRGAAGRRGRHSYAAVPRLSR